VSVRARALALLVAVPAVGAALGLALGPWPLVLVLAAVWALFLLQAFSGRSAWALLRYGRVRRALIEGGGRDGARRTIAVPRRSEGAPTLAWCHDGWAHADGHLVGLDLLDARYDVTAFGTESRARGAPPVTLELLPAVRHQDGIMLEGLEELLRPFDVAWAGGSYEGTTLQALDARARGGPAVVSYEVENIVANYGHVSHPIRERAVREVDHFCAISTAAKAVLELDGVEPERISVVPPVVETPAYGAAERAAMRTEGRRRWELAADDVVFLFMGRAVWEKGLHTIAAAAATLARRGEGGAVRWLIAGEGDYLPEFERIVAGYGVGEAVRVAGPVAGRERHLAYAAADALLVPSLPTPRWLEQFGRVIPEGFAFGLPVIGSASGAIPEVVGDAGIVVPPGDHLALADAVARLTDPALRDELSQRARRRLEAEYSVTRYVELIAEAVEQARRRRGAAST
jgi:glycosyltransferase involved in cell wall biosynthesis